MTYDEALQAVSMAFRTGDAENDDGTIDCVAVLDAVLCASTFNGARCDRLRDHHGSHTHSEGSTLTSTMWSSLVEDNPASTDETPVTDGHS